jgi:hypothetical protein
MSKEYAKHPLAENVLASAVTFYNDYEREELVTAPMSHMKLWDAVNRMVCDHQPATTWTSPVSVCSHKFVDSNHCLKCGWSPSGR